MIPLALGAVTGLPEYVNIQFSDAALVEKLSEEKHHSQFTPP